MQTYRFTSVAVAVALIPAFAGCGPSNTAPGPQAAPTNAAEPATVTVTAGPVLERALSAWQAADQGAAVVGFTTADWTARPLFASNSVMSLSEAQFAALSAAEREAGSGEMLRQVDGLKRLAAAVAQTGREAAARGDTGQARKCFIAVQQCGAALDQPESLKMVRMVGSALRKMGDAELARLAK